MFKLHGVCYRGFVLSKPRQANSVGSVSYESNTYGATPLLIEIFIVARRAAKRRHLLGCWFSTLHAGKLFNGSWKPELSSQERDCVSDVQDILVDFLGVLGCILHLLNLTSQFWCRSLMS
ncbi:hypothetical protein BC936DRAFT_140653 [Jimgerdemannia flammicorona]|uniref:Uncharacterized protein n=1 Tax=Jimgerdemannia flammicorona TaxID=994334 RepID=A0A433DGW6_9FUNG|nr:hypothetical protein BC936DRAFT_140653 [Jimgerdemannia flammicorona]